MRKAFGFFAILMTVSILLWSQRGKWDRYYQNKVGQPPREIVSHAIDRFSQPGVAIDLGAGVGNEAVYMVNHGWLVHAVDKEPQAIHLLQNRNHAKLLAIHADYSQGIICSTLPDSDLILACYSLPFVPKAEFRTIWDNLCGKLSSGGRFAGHFFGEQFVGFSSEESRQMTFLSREEVLELFKEFDIEFFEETIQDDQSGTGKSTHSHVFEVIARKI